MTIALFKSWSCGLWETPSLAEHDGPPTAPLTGFGTCKPERRWLEVQKRFVECRAVPPSLPATVAVGDQKLSLGNFEALSAKNEHIVRAVLEPRY